MTAAAYPMHAGAAAAAVDVEIGTPLSGYAAREGGVTDTHDPCTARAVAVEDTCWVAVDVCGLDRATCASVAERVGLPDGHLVVTATHTHSGPACTPGRLGGDDALTRSRVIDAVVRAATQALAARRPVRLRWSSVRGAGVAVDRRAPSRPVDPPVDLVRLVAGDGDVVGWLVSYPCHPVVMAADNRSVSADYVWALRDELEAQAAGSVAVFLPGTCGNVNNGHAAEASYTSAPLAGRTFAEAERIGRHLARTALAGRRFEIDVTGAVEVRQTSVELALAPLDTEPPTTLGEHWTAELAGAEPGRGALLRAWLEWARQRSDGDALAYPAVVTAVRWGGLWVVGVPGEPFLSFVDGLRRRVDGPVLVTGYTGDCPGYLPDAEAYAHGGYEVTDAHRYYGMPAPFARGSAERLLEAAAGLLSTP
jgi:neutral ceramidase